MAQTRRVYGEGSFYYDANRDKWRLRKTVQAGDQSKVISVYADTQKQCLRLMKEKEVAFREFVDVTKDSLHDSQSAQHSKVILKTAIQEWLKVFKLRNTKSKSYDALESTLNNQIAKYPIGNRVVPMITALEIQNHLNDIQTTHSISTAKKAYSLLKQYLEYYYGMDRVKNPIYLVKAPSNSKKIEMNEQGEVIKKNHHNRDITVLSDAEMKLLETELSIPYKQGVEGYTYGHILLFIMWSFIRIGECLALQWKDIDFEKGTMRIYKNCERVKKRDKKGETTGSWEFQITTAKTESGMRIIKLNAKALEHLKKHRELSAYTAPSDFILVSKNNKHMSQQYLGDILKNALDKAGIERLPSGKHKVTLHGLRHTGISYFIRHDVDIKIISEMAGHANVAITQDIYYNIIQEQRNAEIDKINSTIYQLDKVIENDQ